MAHIDACIYGRKVKRIFELRLKPVREKYDVKMIELEILLYFYENEGKTASDLYRDLGRNKGQVSVGIDNLCKQEYLMTYINPDDRRYLQYKLLERGTAVVHEVQKEVCNIYKDIMDGISPEDQKRFFEIGLKICESIDRCE